MKAIVIDDKPGPDCLKPDFHFGEEVTLEDVSGMAIDLTTGKEFECKDIAVIVKEYSYCSCGCGTIELFSKKRFAPLSEENNKVLDEQEALGIRTRISALKIIKSL
jgi:hypothetical protein